MSITAGEMRSKLLTLDEVTTQLLTTEPVKAQPFTVGDAIRFGATSDFSHGSLAKDGNEPVGVFVTIGRPAGQQQSFQLTRNSLEETCHAFGFPKAYVRDCPAELLVPHMNYWFREGLFSAPRKGKDFEFLINDETAVAFARQGMVPFSNLALLDQAVAAITERFGEVEIKADYKFSHTLRSTALRLVLPASRTMTDTGTPDDIWSLGLQLRNSLTGTTPTSWQGYLFRWVCTNGQIDARASSGVWTRRKDAGQDEVYAWARQAVDDALSGLDGAFDAVQSLTQLGIDGSLTDTLRDIFEHYKIPVAHRSKIITYLEHYDGEITMYVIMNAITQVANDPDLEASTVESLMRVGGDFAHTADQRCGACHRLMHSH
jgi:hypothetical protein